MKKTIKITKQDNRGRPINPPAVKPRVKPAKGVTVGVTAAGSMTASWRGYSKSSILRWCGAMGWSTDDAKKLLTKLGMGATENNVKCQVSDGRRQAEGGKMNYGPVPQLSKADGGELKRLIGK